MPIFISCLLGAVLATDGVDYIHIGLVPQEVVFEDGDSAIKTFSITLIDDTEPELDEQFTVVLSNLPAGTALIDPDAVSCMYVYIHIKEPLFITEPKLLSVL